MGGEVGAFGAGGGLRGLGQRLGQPLGARAGRAGVLLAAATRGGRGRLPPRTRSARPSGTGSCRGRTRRSAPALRGLRRRGSCTAARRSGRAGRASPRSARQVRDRLVERVDVREQLRDHDSVMLDLEAALPAPRVAAGIFARILPLASSASSSGSVTPDEERFEHRSRGLRVRREATLVSLIPASWSTFSKRWIVRVRSLLCALRSRVRSRSRRISGGGTKLGRTSPCCTSWQIHSESLTSVLRPGNDQDHRLHELRASLPEGGDGDRAARTRCSASDWRSKAAGRWAACRA